MNGLPNVPNGLPIVPDSLSLEYKRANGCVRGLLVEPDIVDDPTVEGLLRCFGPLEDEQIGYIFVGD